MLPPPMPCLAVQSCHYGAGAWYTMIQIPRVRSTRVCSCDGPAQGRLCHYIILNESMMLSVHLANEASVIFAKLQFRSKDDLVQLVCQCLQENKCDTKCSKSSNSLKVYTLLNEMDRNLSRLLVLFLRSKYNGCEERC